MGSRRITLPVHARAPCSVSSPSHPQRTSRPVDPRLPRLVALVVVNPSDRWRLIDAFRERATVTFVHTVAELDTQLAAAEATRDVAAVMIEPLDQEGAHTAPVVARYRARLEGVPFIGYCLKGIEHSKELLALARAGVDEVLFQGDELSRVTLGDALASATQASAAGDVLALVRPHVCAEAERFLSHTLYNATEDYDVPKLAAAFGINQATLLRRFRRYDLPAPGPFITWCRLMIAGHLLQDGRRAVEDVVLALGFASPSAFRNLTKRYVGLRPLELRAAGGLRPVLAAFTAPTALGRSLRTRAGRGKDARPGADEDQPGGGQDGLEQIASGLPDRGPRRRA